MRTLILSLDSLVKKVLSPGLRAAMTMLPLNHSYMPWKYFTAQESGFGEKEFSGLMTFVPNSMTKDPRVSWEEQHTQPLGKLQQERHWQQKGFMSQAPAGRKKHTQKNPPGPSDTQESHSPGKELPKAQPPGVAASLTQTWDALGGSIGHCAAFTRCLIFSFSTFLEMILFFSHKPEWSSLCTYQGRAWVAANRGALPARTACHFPAWLSLLSGCPRAAPLTSL